MVSPEWDSRGIQSVVASASVASFIFFISWALMYSVRFKGARHDSVLSFRYFSLINIYVGYLS